MCPEVMSQISPVVRGKLPPRTARLRVPASGDGVHDVLARLAALLVAASVPAEERGNAEIVMAEMLNNIVEHAYRGTGNGVIDVVFDVTKTRLRVKVSDCGDPMPDDRMPCKQAASVDVARQDLPEGGFGWFLIHELVEQISYRRCASNNIIRFTMRLI